ncbi:MAG TPA: hypothetical protein VFA26_14840 [Gemmataceae bacterium]|nr:hypothetical protein [Gemmataceae bacterium]
MPPLHLATFAADVTCPAGHPLCGGWIEPARAVDDPLRAVGVVLLGMGRPVVLCAVDWCGIRNDAHLAWRKALAEAAHTVPENVAVHCVHPHNAPFADTEAEKLIRAAPQPTSSLDLKFFDQAVKRTADAVKASLAKTARFTHVGLGKAKVEKVASNRRVIGEDGKVKYTRTSATKDPRARAEPEGLIDPWLRTLSFWDGDKPLAALHYYATHPMSYYGDGRVTSDFCGLARDRRAADEPKVFQVYFTGCAGNVTAGKYNDGAKENRAVLRDRIYEGMKAAWRATERYPLKEFAWRIEPVKLPPRKEKSFGEEESRKALEDPKQKPAKRNNAAFQLAWLRRIGRPIDFACLDLGKALVLHLPGEPFIEYQLKAQELRPDRFVCVAGYGDDGPGYIPTNKAFLEGGYEPTVALAAPSEPRMYQAMAKLLQAKPPR